ncbi:MAG: glycoside hydrolase, partial [Gemmatimonadetes bacterium]|nr:glycoside hydrolase [Gemmatimonadota bacterium]
VGAELCICLMFYIGVNGGGVWKTTDYGRSWVPIFDDQPTGSIGAIGMSESNPDVIYVGSGEGLQRPDLSTGDGIYKSVDGGKSWTHLGLRDGQQIAAIAVDPRTPDRLLVAVLGHPYGPNAERGIFRSTDGGKTFTKVLYRDEDTGGMDVAYDPTNPAVAYAVLWAARQAPWEVGSSWTLSDRNGFYKSTDGGATWRRTGRGLPTAADGLGRIGIEVSRADPKRLYAIVGAERGGGLYRSDDAGESWTLVNGDERLWGRDGDFNEVRADPKNPDVVYVANIVAWKSTDGGKTFTAWRGAPGGDDYHRLWIDPDDPRVILLTADQGAVVTVNGGETWSSWYNQPTAQFYHVNTDNSFPYRVCGGQQESGSACVQSRGDDGAITFREWHPVGVEEYGYAVPDPLDPDVVYGGKISRYDRRTGQTQNVAPRQTRGPDFRVVRTQPVVFSPTDPHTLYFASNVLWKTTDGGRSWEKISPDLTRTSYEVPKNLGVFAPLDPEKGKHRGVIYTIAPSYVKGSIIWVGTDDGLIHVTHDGGKTWRDVTPPELRAAPWSKISIMDASHTDTLEAYAAVNTFRLDDLRPHIWRTRDGGRTWQHVTAGIPDGGIVNVVREDPVKKGLLFAGTEREVYFSTDDGDHWRSLRLNMPAVSIRDLVIKDADLVVATHGRGFWILDDISPLRQLDALATSAPAALLRPAPAWRFRWNKYTDTPLPPGEPMGENPPDGAILDYWLAAAPKAPVTLEVLDAAGTLVRRYSSADPAPPPRDEGNVPAYWIRPPQRPQAAPGLHRFVWDLHWTPPAAPETGFPIAAVPGNTPREPRGPWALPGQYTVRLTVDGRSYTAPLTVRMDPRVKATPAELARQLETAQRLADAMRRDSVALAGIGALRRRLAAAPPAKHAPAASPGAGASEAEQAARLEGELRRIDGQLARLYDTVNEVDAAPTPALLAAVEDQLKALDDALARWAALGGRR